MARGYKTGGREKGTPNKATYELRERLKAVYFEELERLPALLDELSPRERVDVLVKLSAYLFPKIETVLYREDDPKANW